MLCDPPKTALILCGGGSKGAMEVGLYRALVELDPKALIKALEEAGYSGSLKETAAPPAPRAKD